MNWIEIAIAVLQLIPAIIKAMTALEEALPNENIGPLKLGIIKETLLSINEKSAEIWPTLEKVISTIVSVFNKVGIFKTTKQL